LFRVIEETSPQGEGCEQLSPAWEQTCFSGRRKRVAKLSPRVSPSRWHFLCLRAAEGRASPEQSLAFCRLDFVPPQEPFPRLSCCCISEPPKKKKKKLLDLCFPGVSVPHLTYQSLSRQEAAEMLSAKPSANGERSPAAACDFARRSPVSSPFAPRHACSHPPNPTDTFAVEMKVVSPRQLPDTSPAPLPDPVLGLVRHPAALTYSGLARSVEPATGLQGFVGFRWGFYAYPIQRWGHSRGLGATEWWGCPSRGSLCRHTCAVVKGSGTQVAVLAFIETA